MSRDYRFYTEDQKRFLRRYAENLGFQPGTRTPDGIWATISDDFFKRFNRHVSAGRLAFQARTLWKDHQDVLNRRRIARRRRALVSVS